MVRPARPAAILVGNHSASEQTLYGRPLARETVCRRVGLPCVTRVACVPTCTFFPFHTIPPRQCLYTLYTGFPQRRIPPYEFL